jgi:hypothetical protein
MSLNNEVQVSASTVIVNNLNYGAYVLRAPGGYIYELFNSDLDIISAVFVPETLTILENRSVE